jgi:enolase-phosphatase E1
MKFEGVKYVLTDIEGTTTSVKFVYDQLFPYFRSHIGDLKSMIQLPDVQEAFRLTVKLSLDLEGRKLNSVDEIINTLYRWSEEDRKITPLKSVQGILWEDGYKKGELKGHVYADVLPALEQWKSQGIQMGVFSSGSIAAQKLIFGFSELGDLTPFFSHYFDTTTGGKKEAETYPKIANAIGFQASKIIFLSDITDELVAADAAGLQTVQLVRPGTEASWKNTVKDFSELELA